MPEARRLKNGRWRLYRTPDLYPVRDPESGAILTFDTLSEARRWWMLRNPVDAPPQEAVRCAKCGAYLSSQSAWRLYAGRYYHAAHAPPAIDAQRRRLS
jgi:hypothetical protein